MTTRSNPLFAAGRIGSLEIRNRFIRAATSETMAGPRGEVTEELVSLYETLARNDVGLIITGHLYCEPRGQYAPRQTGISSDDLIPGLRRLTGAVHRHGGKIFAELSHAGSKASIQGITPLTPSPALTPGGGRTQREADEGDIQEVLRGFAEGARRAVEAGFDGIHVHGAHGYLISEFCSPLTNKRTDAWGGTPEGRERFLLEVVRAVRSVIPPAFPFSMKLGFVDAAPGGLGLEESVPRAQRLVRLGVNAIEVSCNLMADPFASAQQYVAVSGWRALRDLLVHRILSPPVSEAYFLPWARALRQQVDTTIILVGGIRSLETMESIVGGGHADFVSMARPFIREPDLVRQIALGRRGLVACTSCNICILHEGRHSLRCWRVPRRRLVQHALYRLAWSLENRGSRNQEEAR